MDLNPDFYLACEDLSKPFEPRCCYIEQRLSSLQRDDFLLVRISPSIEQFYGAKEIDKIVLASRFVGSTLFPINEWPMHVYVCKIVNSEICISGKANASDLEIILWGKLFHTFSDAAENVK
jgi:hypothetical protein